MQNTRLNSLVGVVGDRFSQSLRNPWRRLSLLAMSVLFGLFLGQSITTIAGQEADWDITVAGVLLVVTEAVSWIVYGYNRRFAKSLWVETLNALKIGVVYGLFLEAVKLAS